MKKSLIGLFLVAVVAATLYFFFGRGALQQVSIKPAEPEIVSQAAAIPPVVATNEINVEGRLVPAQHLNLEFSVSGIVKEVLVAEGQQVEEGQVIARLRDEDQMKLAVAHARLKVMNAEKALNDLRISAPLQAAQINYDITQVKKDLEKYEKRRASMDYPRATQKKIDEAYDDLMAAQDMVKQIQDYGGDTQEARDALKTAEAARDTAQANYNWLLSTYSTLEKAEAEALVLLNQRKLEDLERRYAIYAQGPDPDEERIAKVNLEIAMAEMEAAEAKFADLELRAPFSGTVVTMDLEEGKLVSPGGSVALLANFSRWYIETEDLTELSVTRIQEGAEASVNFDALPDASFNGKVVSIKNIGENKQGDITYTAVIEIDSDDPRLRWNMTSPIVIRTK